MSEEKKQMTVGDLKEMLKSIKLPSKSKTHLIAMIMAIPTWGAIWWPLLSIQLIGLTIMLLNIKFRNGSIFSKKTESHIHSASFNKENNQWVMKEIQ